MTLVLLAFAWFIGNNLADATDESRATLTGYIAHAFVGGTILILTVVRLFCYSGPGFTDNSLRWFSKIGTVKNERSEDQEIPQSGAQGEGCA